MPEKVSDENVKVYQEKSYCNSNKEPFGVTLKGKSKDYVSAHEKFKGTLIKNKIISTSVGKMKVLDASQKQGFINATIEVHDKNGDKGNVDLKVYNPSLNKKKGATIEIRKISDSEYKYVEILKEHITKVLDRNLEDQVSSSCEFYICNICKWQTSFEPALKGHKKRMHVANTNKNTNICTECGFCADTQTSLTVHIDTEHARQKRKRTKVTHKCDVVNCDSTFYYESNLKEHKISQHGKVMEENFFQSGSPSSSPPRKKSDIIVTESEEEMLDLDEMEIVVEKELNMRFILEKKIKELELQLKEERKKHAEEKLILLKQNEDLRNKGMKRIPKHLTNVHEEHLAGLRGFRMRYAVRGDGRCLENCAAIHTLGDENEGSEIRKMINNYLADEWKNYWKNKISLPFKEILIVDGKKVALDIKTDEDMVNYLRSESAMKTFSNGHEILAIANLFKINIHIFTYKGNTGNWIVQNPDPEVNVSAGVPISWATDMFLYHNSDTHYDLLVGDDSNLAKEDLLGPLKSQNEWKKVTSRRKKLNVTNDAEKLLIEEDLDDLEEELTLYKSKKSGHRRVGPQAQMDEVSKVKESFNCDQCGKVLESQGLLNAHIASHDRPQFMCDDCDLNFGKCLDLEMHKIEVHEVPSAEQRKLNLYCNECDIEFTTINTLETHIQENHGNSEEWNCNDCPFQAHSADELMKHLKMKSHQPSPAIRNRKVLFRDYKQCYTCNLEFDGFRNLMEHRKHQHPSNKKCRNYPEGPEGRCIRGKACWYIHEEQLMEVDESVVSENSFEGAKFKCNHCEKSFKGKNDFMRHNKLYHIKNVANCEKYEKGLCTRNDNQCWYKHQGCLNQSKQHVDDHDQHHPQDQQQVFQQALENPPPPEQMTRIVEKVDNLCMKMERMEEKLEKILN